MWLFPISESFKGAVTSGYCFFMWPRIVELNRNHFWEKGMRGPSYKNIKMLPGIRCKGLIG